MPQWVSNEARQSDERQGRRGVFQEGLQGAIREDGRLEVVQSRTAAAERTDPSRPEGTFFGIESADENGYRIPPTDGAVTKFASIDLVLVYSLNADPDSLAVALPDGSIDSHLTIAALKTAGYSGLRVNQASTEQEENTWDPLQIEESKPSSDGGRTSRHQKPVSLNQPALRRKKYRLKPRKQWVGVSEIGKFFGDAHQKEYGETWSYDNADHVKQATNQIAREFR